MHAHLHVTSPNIQPPAEKKSSIQDVWCKAPSLKFPPPKIAKNSPKLKMTVPTRPRTSHGRLACLQFFTTSATFVTVNGSSLKTSTKVIWEKMESLFISIRQVAAANLQLLVLGCIQPPNLPLPLGVRDPDLRQYVTGPHKCTCQMV